MKVRFNYADRKLSFSPKSALKKAVENIFKSEGVEFKSMNYIFCSDEFLLEINRNALSHDYYTDIITFPMHEKGLPVEGEVYISIDRVRENAVTHNVTFKEELARVIAHGALHLCGYEDKSKEEIAIMREKESSYISKM